MHNVKAFLEGLIVNEVLTKTASFEKLAYPPVYWIPQGLQTGRAIEAAKALWQRWRDSQQPPARNTRKDPQRPVLNVQPRLPTGMGNDIDHGIMKGKPPSKDEAVESAKKILGDWLGK
jgi:hypothetical protein